MQYDPAKTVELIKKFQDGDKEAFNGIYEGTYRLVYNACYGVLGNEDDAQDITQDTFIQIYKKLDTLQDPSAYAKWMKLTATRLAINHVTRSDKFETVEDDTVLDVYSNDWSEFDSLPDSFIEEEEQRQILDDILRKSLSEVQYQTLFMHFFDEMNIEQIADAMNCPSGTVKTRLMHAKAKIRKPLEKYFDPGKAVYAAVPFLTRFFTANAVKTGIPPIAVLGIPGVAGTAGLAGVEAGAEAGVKGGFLSTVAGKVIAGVAALAVIGAAVTVAVVVNKKEEPRQSPVVTAETNDSSGTQSSDIANNTSNIGSQIKMGYYADSNLEWIVLDENDSEVLLLSKYAIEQKPYNDEFADVTWEECSLRHWLNDEFYSTAFNDSEKNGIKMTTVINGDNPFNGTEGGNDTEDRVFLLSIEEANRYFDSDESRMAKATEHAKANGVVVSVGTSAWWLRSPGCARNIAAAVYSGGNMEKRGSDVAIKTLGVRPAMWVSKECLSDAGNRSAQPSADAPSDVFSDVKTGSIVTFGNYAGEDIEWKVIDENDDSVLLLSQYVLDFKAYNDTDAKVTWETCTLRKWLNEDFINTSFTPEEMGSIQLTHLVNPDNPNRGISGGNDTDDRVFILSLDEVYKYFGAEADRLAKPTEQALSGKSSDVLYKGHCSWLVRTPGQNKNTVSSINSEGTLTDGWVVYNNNTGVRPAMWVSK